MKYHVIFTSPFSYHIHGSFMKIIKEINDILLHFEKLCGSFLQMGEINDSFMQFNSY